MAWPRKIGDLASLHRSHGALWETSDGAILSSGQAARDHETKLQRSRAQAAQAAAAAAAVAAAAAFRRTHPSHQSRPQHSQQRATGAAAPAPATRHPPLPTGAETAADEATFAAGIAASLQDELDFNPELQAAIELSLSCRGDSAAGGARAAAEAAAEARGIVDSAPKAKTKICGGRIVREPDGAACRGPKRSYYESEGVLFVDESDDDDDDDKADRRAGRNDKPVAAAALARAAKADDVSRLRSSKKARPDALGSAGQRRKDDAIVKGWQQ